MTSVNIFAVLLLVCTFSTLYQAEAFTAPSKVRTTSVLQAGRRDFLDAALATTAGFVIASIPSVAGAEEAVISDDLAMPTEEEQKKIDEDAAAAQAERLRRKAELQKAKSRPANFKDSLASEREKQKGLQMSNQERRNALCEELGRGC